MRIFVGVDVSKGYVDIAVLSQAGEVISTGRYDDTSRGHDAVKELLDKVSHDYAGTELVVGIESTGGLERNWLHFFKHMKSRSNVIVFHLNALVVKRFSQLDLHRSITDKISAAIIAKYLKDGLRTKDVPFTKHPTLRRVCRYTMKTIKHCAQLKTELQALLPTSHPDLVTYCQEEMPNWILHVLCQYPTAKHLSLAQIKDLVEIPYITESRAKNLVTEARQSVASETDEDTALVIEMLAHDILDHEKKVTQLKHKCCSELENEQGYQVLQSIPGIGAWIAAVLFLEIGDIYRFYSAEALVAFAGLDPCYKTSGDGTWKMGISKEGRSSIRAKLYLAVMTGLSVNPLIREWYDGYRSKGKAHYYAMTVCMRKLLIVCYACWTKGESFDVSRPKRDKTRMEHNKRETNKRQTNNRNEVKDPKAPISRMEAKKRKAATSSQQGSDPGIGDQVAAMKSIK